ncbi:hypothetical protein [Nocardia sp. SC052]|uniref:hypothetical protein n=1 Tax=Nocardia sichangensis TaxID=3385975 RepID=UPI0039A06F39
MLPPEFNISVDRFEQGGFSECGGAHVLFVFELACGECAAALLFGPALVEFRGESGDP